ncbi:MAG: GAF domain-containing protein [Thermoguttaceae bacterium]|nr:GAF domain-containing protein [Thermoguttaceae bacterium]MDW8077813.1 GAF domain-containing protein [Thermoguttaceae bacterium]
MNCIAPHLQTLTIEDLYKILDRIDAAVAIVDADKRIQWANARFQQWFNQGGTLEGASFYYVLGDPQIEGPVFAPFQEAANSEAPVRCTLLLPDRRHVQLDVVRFDSSSESGPRFLVTLQDVSEERAVAERIERIYRAGAELTAIRPDFLVSMTYEERLAWVEACIIQHLTGLFNFDSVEIRRLDRRTGELVRILSIGMTREAEARRLRPNLEGAGITGYVAATGNTYICEDTLLDPRYLPGAEGARSSLTVPLLFENEVIGTFNVESKKRAAFSQEDARFLQIYCRELARALVMLDLLEAQRHLAGACKVEEIHSRLADPVDEIYSELVKLQEIVRTSGTVSAEVLHQSIQFLLGHAQGLKKLVWDIGQELPPIPATLQVAQQKEASVLHGKHVLVVVTDPNSRMQIRQILERLGGVVTTVGTGRGGLLMLDHEAFDAVVVELHLADMESKEFIQSAIEQKGFSPHRLVLMSEYGYDPHHNVVAARTRQVNAIFLKEKLSEQLVPKFVEVLSAR